MYYQLCNHLQPLEPNAVNMITKNSVEVIKYEECQNHSVSKIIALHLPKGYKNIHFSKLESYPTYLLGTLSIPRKNNFQTKINIIFCIEKNKVTFIDDSNFVTDLLYKIKESRYWETPSIENFFSDFLEELISHDLFYLEELENKICKLETVALSGETPNFNHKMLELRRELLTLSYYYSQLIDIGDSLQENEHLFFQDANLKCFNLFLKRVTHLQTNIQMLKEYTTQIREQYQAQIDIKQNNTMSILTVVTSIFLPLTLVVGWYGMNFAYMPELNWKYGYPFVILLSIIIIFICMWIIKKKKFL